MGGLPQFATMNSRRNFLLSLVASTPVPALLGGSALAQSPASPGKLDESDPVAKALGFKLDTTKVDKTKYPQHSVEQKCSGCALYVAKAGDTVGACTALGNKEVPDIGWCVAFAKKPPAAK